MATLHVYLGWLTRGICFCVCAASFWSHYYHLLLHRAWHGAALLHRCLWFFVCFMWTVSGQSSEDTFFLLIWQKVVLSKWAYSIRISLWTMQVALGEGDTMIYRVICKIILSYLKTGWYIYNYDCDNRSAYFMWPLTQISMFTFFSFFAGGVEGRVLVRRRVPLTVKDWDSVPPGDITS